MSKQMVKSLTMLTLVIGLTLAAAVVSANGQGTSQRVTANIPFDFVVADKTLPSGKYSVGAATSDGQGLKISGAESAMILTNTVADKSEKRNARMVFHRYGSQYFLAEVWSGDDYGRQLRQCKRERNLRRELASNAAKSDLARASYEIVEVVAIVR